MQLKSYTTNVRGAAMPSATARLFSLIGSLFMLSITFPAHAALQRVGPVSNAPSIGGFPTWYQDKGGLALEFCDPLNQSEVAGGWCLLLAPDVPTVPETFPTPFFDEHFYFAADSALAPLAGDSRVKLTMALEGAFATGPVIAGDQQVFTRIRIEWPTVPVTGTYRFIHPYGEDRIDGVAGDRIFFTDDVGIACAKGSFDCALNSRVGPFLLPSQTPGGAEIAPVTAANPAPDTNPANFGGAFLATPYPQTGKAYIADPARSGPVTGSPLPPFTDSTGALRDHNIFRMEGPAGSNIGGPGIDFLETTNFALQGRVFQGQIAGLVKVDRASYTAAVSGNKLDVFASGFTTAQTRMPASAAPAPAVPTLSFYDAACVVDAVTGAVTAPPAPAIETPMIADGTRFWAETHPAAIPAAVCVKDSSSRDVNGNVIPAYFTRTVTDEVAITQANYDPAGLTLAVAATSSDTLIPASLTLEPAQPLVGGQILVPSVLVPTAKVTVLSSAGGSVSLLVNTGTAADATQPPPTTSFTAVNDLYTFAEDSGAQLLPVLANDAGVTGGSVAIVVAPRLGTAVVNADGTVTYTSNLDANGTDSFTYQVTVGTAVTNIANVALNITQVNDAPVAVDDTNINVNVNVATVLPSLITNDTDVDGNLDVVAATDFTQPTPAGASITTDAAGNVTFTATTAGTYTFTYHAVDAAGAVSANAATVTVNAISNDTIVVSSALFRDDQKRWVISGTGSAPNQTIFLTYEDGSAAGFEVGQATVTVTGAWTLDIRGVTGNEDPNSLATRPT
ncbi:MAG: cadherin-like domain-containing protein, partial [Myxococcales bacterium]